MAHISAIRVFSGNVAKLSTKSARDSSESSICSSKCLKKGVRSTFGRSGRRDVNQTVARARLALPDCSESLISPRQCKKLTRSEQLRICVVKSARLTLRELWLICCDTPAMRVCNRLWKIALAPLRAAKHEWCMRRFCYARLQLEVAKRNVTAARREELGCRSYRGASWEAAQTTVREEVAKIRGCFEKNWFIDSLVHWFIESLHHEFAESPIQWFIELTHWFIGSLIDRAISSLIQWFIDLLVHCFIDSQNHRFIGLLTHWLIASLTHWCTVSLNPRCANSLIHGFIHRITDSLIHWYIESSVHWFIESSVHSVIDSLICWCIEALIHWITDSWVHWLIDTFVVNSLHHRFTSSFMHGLTSPLIFWFNELIHWFIDPLLHWPTASLIKDSLVHVVFGSCSQLCMDSFKSFH